MQQETPMEQRQVLVSFLPFLNRNAPFNILSYFFLLKKKLFDLDTYLHKSTQQYTGILSFTRIQA